MSSSDNYPLGYFLRSAGPATRPTLYLGWVFTAICVAVCLIVLALLVIAIWRRRPPDDGIVAPDARGLRWVFIGTGISVVVLVAMGIYALTILNRAANPPSPPGLTIAVTGYQWWWRADYDTDDPAQRVTTANEIHIPTGTSVMLTLQSADVIHAFWTPLLAGKTQMIPGLTTRQWLQADQPGIYRGQCTQFCGVQHAHMAYEVVAQSPADFAAWRMAQAKPAAPPATPLAKAGQAVFLHDCAGCHAVRGTDADGQHAPDLTHIMSRRLLAAGLMPNTPANLAQWVEHAQEMKPGSRMPDFSFSPADRASLLAYLETLQ